MSLLHSSDLTKYDVSICVDDLTGQAVVVWSIVPSYWKGRFLDLREVQDLLATSLRVQRRVAGPYLFKVACAA